MNSFRLILDVSASSALATKTIQRINVAGLKLLHSDPENCTPTAITRTPRVFYGLWVRDRLTLQCVKLVVQPENFQNFVAVKDLSLVNVEFTGNLHEFFTYFRALKVLKLIDLNITTISPTVLSGIDGKLEQLMIGGGKRVIEPKSFEKFHQLQNLTLRNCQLTDLQVDIFEGLEQLHYLNLGSNEISVLCNDTFSKLTQLSELHLDDNRISEIQAEAFSGLNLRTIDLRNNSLTSVPVGVFRNLLDLETLNLGLNKIRTVSYNDFCGCIQLRWLNLDYNEIYHIDASAFWGFNFNILDLSHNNLTVLDDNTFIGLTVSDLLDLRANNITQIKSQAFNNLSAKKVLLCHHNSTYVGRDNWSVEDTITEIAICDCTSTEYS
ncbi:insulin-like growth factor-binding protein complex acid labile subunit [Diachasma alloeum]|uniref:insulin-like growth factor-binding protein complex acid labile subunit n=1 Tax=Diachasma alloeum TaxID=454923 RepID=UPI0007381D81|nr:insulin-like growth factor-binding protein complex acid labile subunit [Diachasma alloeum]